MDGTGFKERIKHVEHIVAQEERVHRVDDRRPYDATLTSALGQQQKSRAVMMSSALPPEADIGSDIAHFCVCH